MQKTAIALAVSLVVAACGGTADEAGDSSAVPATTVATTTTTSSTTTTTAAPGGFPVTVEHATGTTTIGALPQSIVSMSATATEILFAIGAGDQVAAVDSQSDYPEAAPRIDLSAFEPSVEAVAALEPDLVVMSFDPGDIESGLQALDIPVIMQFPAASLEDAYSQIEQLGTATGNSAAAATLIGEIQSTIAELEETHGTRDEPLTYYHELDNTFYSVTSSTFIGELYSVLGLDNVADPADAEGYGYPQLSAEYILDADPDLIFLADTKCCGQSAATLAERPGWDELTAVKQGNVIELDDDIASRWGPRIVDFLESIVAAIGGYNAAAAD